VLFLPKKWKTFSYEKGHLSMQRTPLLALHPRDYRLYLASILWLRPCSCFLHNNISKSWSRDSFVHVMLTNFKLDYCKYLSLMRGGSWSTRLSGTDCIDGGQEQHAAVVRWVGANEWLKSQLTSGSYPSCRSPSAFPDLVWFLSSSRLQQRLRKFKDKFRQKIAMAEVI